MKKLLSIFLTLLLLLSFGAQNVQAQTNLVLWLPPFASGDDGALDKEFWTNALKPWAEEKNVNLTIEITPWGGYEEKYLTGFSSGKGPDVGYMYLEMYNDFIELGALAELSQYITDADKENYLYLDKGFVKGGQYAVPFVVGNARLMFFNMDILEKAGVTELPKTWDDFVATALKIKEANLPGVMPVAQEWADPAIGALNNIYYPYLWQAGGDLYNADGTKLALLDNDAAVRAAQFLYDLRHKHNVLPEESMALVGSELRNQFVAGNIAMASMAANSAALLDEAGIKWDFSPSLLDKTYGTWIAADSLIISDACQNKELAMDLVRFITSAPTMEKFHTELSKFPPITKDAKYLDNERFKELYSDATYMHTLPVADNSFKVMDTLYKNLQSMMLGDFTPEEAVQNTVEYFEHLK